MVQGIGYRHDARTVISEAIAAASSPTAHKLALGRALGSGQESTTTTSWSSSSSSPSNGLLVTDTLFPSPTSTSGSGGRHGISQMVLEWIFAVIAIGLLGILIIWRCFYARYRLHSRRGSILPSSRGQGLRPPPRSRSYAHSVQEPQPTHIHDSEDLVSGSTFNRQTRALVLSPSFLHTGLMPLVDGRGVQINTPNATHPRVRGQRVRGLDVDEGGRRGASGGGEDGDGDVGIAEELPAYEIGKGPPGYQIAIGNTARPDVVEVGLPERIEEHLLQHSEESQSIDPSSPRPDYTSSPLGSHPQNRESGASPSPRETPTSQERQPPGSCKPLANLSARF